MSVEWNTETDLEFHEFFPAMDDQERFARTQPLAFNTWDKVVAVLITCAAGMVFWALLAVFCWGGNLVPRW